MKRSERDVRATAYHEAGHAVVAWHEGIRIRSASIMPTEATAGHVVLKPLLEGVQLDATREGAHRARAERHARVSLAGEIAQQRYDRPTAILGEASAQASMIALPPVADAVQFLHVHICLPAGRATHLSRATPGAPAPQFAPFAGGLFPCLLRLVESRLPAAAGAADAGKLRRRHTHCPRPG